MLFIPTPEVGKLDAVTFDLILFLLSCKPLLQLIIAYPHVKGCKSGYKPVQN